MKDRRIDYKNDWSVTFEKCRVMYNVTIRDSRADVHDRVQCDDYRMACDYYRSFKMIAKAAR